MNKIHFNNRTRKGIGKDLTKYYLSKSYHVIGCSRSNTDFHHKVLQRTIRYRQTLEANFYGGESNLDSLGLVSLIVGLEQNIEDELEKTISLADEKAMSQNSSPFKTLTPPLTA